ncbi:hypothetical protein EDC04DRAFT_2601970 [Pisolithus marmoratus]|nr:hypothetical protein EDC04DRAFT_2601970 [Pisolithus marmoratus]
MRVSWLEVRIALLFLCWVVACAMYQVQLPKPHAIKFPMHSILTPLPFSASPSRSYRLSSEPPYQYRFCRWYSYCAAKAALHSITKGLSMKYLSSHRAASNLTFPQTKLSLSSDSHYGERIRKRGRDEGIGNVPTRIFPSWVQYMEGGRGMVRKNKSASLRWDGMRLHDIPIGYPRTAESRLPFDIVHFPSRKVLHPFEHFLDRRVFVILHLLTTVPAPANGSSLLKGPEGPAGILSPGAAAHHSGNTQLCIVDSVASYSWTNGTLSSSRPRYELTTTDPRRDSDEDSETSHHCFISYIPVGPQNYFVSGIDEKTGNVKVDGNERHKEYYGRET